MASVTVTPANSSLEAGETAPLQAQVRDANGRPLSGRAITWTTGSTVATVTSTGIVTAAAEGATTITATSEGKQGLANIHVTPPVVASVEVNPTIVTLAPGAQAALLATAREADGDVVTGRPVTWASDDQACATVDAQGSVTAVGADRVHRELL